MNHCTSVIEMNREEEKFYFSISVIQKKSIQLKDVIHLFHVEERKIFENYSFEHRKWSYVLGRISAKLAANHFLKLPSLASINIIRGVFGFPIVKSPIAKNIQISISHSDTLGVSIAFDETHPMGIDIEKISKDRIGAMLSIVSNDEQLLFKEYAVEELSSLTMIWCAKEALSKVIKTGMMIDFKFLEIHTIEMKKNLFLLSFKNFGQYKGICYSNDTYAISIVLPKKTNLQLDKIRNQFDVSLS